MTCSFEEENKACGRKVGLWGGVLRKYPDAAARADENAAYSQGHMVIRPHRCSLGTWDARKLVAVLAGGRTLKICGDSTMRQLYGALVCSIPLELVAPPQPRRGKGDNAPRLELVGGGRIQLDGFPPGAVWFNTANGKGNFSAAQMAQRLFGDCGPRDICVRRPTLHDVVDDAEIRGLESPAFHDALRPYAALSPPPKDADGVDVGWGIALGPSVQHFKPPGFEEGGEESLLRGCRDPASGAPAGSYTPGAHAVAGKHQQGCLAKVCPPPRDVALSRLATLGLPLAVLGQDLAYHHGFGHILAAPAASMRQDCTHWCAPGLSDAFGSLLVSLVTLYDGNRTKFVQAMLANPQQAGPIGEVTQQHAPPPPPPSSSLSSSSLHEIHERRHGHAFLAPKAGLNGLGGL